MAGLDDRQRLRLMLDAVPWEAVALEEQEERSSSVARSKFREFAVKLPLLSAAAKAGDVDRVRQLLAQGADPNERDLNGSTPLIHAVRPARPATRAPWRRRSVTDGRMWRAGVGRAPGRDRGAGGARGGGRECACAHAAPAVRACLLTCAAHRPATCG